MSLSSPVGTVTTWTIDPVGALEDWVVPFHDGEIQVTCYGGPGSRSGPSPNGAGGAGNGGNGGVPGWMDEGDLTWRYSQVN